ncbi:pyridoxal-dependent decarboxylase domain-containing protein 1-like isoform X2 [Symsagittifera roscoffensis]|uniref:pyridoxal-dependent decarboxylase domain-containing protein 1-like isoform X2 n=1 Tax=Symsagittifera roscoffensis TaxID=84072 RepID=UPI00307C8EC4
MAATMEKLDNGLTIEMFNTLLRRGFEEGGEQQGGSEMVSAAALGSPRLSKSFEYCHVDSEYELMKHLVSFLSHSTLSRTERNFGQKSSDFLVIEENERQAQLAALISHLARLDHQVLRTLTRRILADTSHWMSTLFKFPQSKCYFHLREIDGVIGACRMALHKQYPSFALNGFKIWLPTTETISPVESTPEGDSEEKGDSTATGDSSETESASNDKDGDGSVSGEKKREPEKLPVIYIPQCTSPGWADTCLRQLGLPMDCLFTLSCNHQEEMSKRSHSKDTEDKLSDTIDVAAFDKAVQHHIANNMKPLFLLTHAGTWLMGQSDNIQALSAICSKYNMWMHVVGSNLAALGILSSSIPESIACVPKVADSITVQPREWLAIPMAPRVTIYRDTDPALTAPAGLGSDYDHSDLHVIPLWANLQLLGQDKISSMLHFNASLAQQLAHKISSIPQLFLLSQSSAVSSVVLFQFSLEDADKIIATQNKFKLEPEYQIDQDAINMWLYKKLRVETSKVVLDLVQLSTNMYLRFSPNMSSSLRGTNSDHINELSHIMKKLCTSGTDTLLKRKELVQIFLDTENHSVMSCSVRFVSAPEWAGLAVLRYVPEYCEKPVIEGIVVPDQEERAQEEIERLNKLLCQKLSEAFPDVIISEGLVGKLWAIKVSMVPFNFNCSEFLMEFSNSGKKLEDSSAFIAGLGSVVESMIRAASEQLQEEQTNQFWQEGVLRNLPLFGGIYSWILPAGTSPIKGRSFNLSSGSLESTEFVYEHKLQYHEAPNSQLKKVDEELPAKGGNS